MCRIPPDVKSSTFTYYNERAGEYDELYLSGSGPASIKNPEAYRHDVHNVKEILHTTITGGTVIDIPCGTAFWMSSYYHQAERVILVDQAANMLIKSRERAATLTCKDKCTFILSDLFTSELPDIRADFALVGFFLSHPAEAEETAFFNILKRHLNPQHTIFVLDSTWSEERARTREKEGIQNRKLNDGAFSIYKKYFTAQDAIALGKRYGYQTAITYYGETMFIAHLHQEGSAKTAI